MKKTIVIIEDNEMLNRVLEYRLKNDGYKVKVFVNGKDAMNFMLDNPFDLLITGLFMPQMNGVDIIKAVRQKISAKIPVIVIIGLYEEELLNRAILLGANDFLAKPFRAGELCMRVKGLLNGSLLKRRLLTYEQ